MFIKLNTLFLYFPFPNQSIVYLSRISILLLVFLVIGCSKESQNNKQRKANELIHETSPYLLQHAYNPVNWKAWNDNTLELAKKEQKLMVVSIGYSSCHWCHVMEEESFENDTIAKLMNDSFINIKIDREERPDIDQIYVNAVELMTGNAGWPLNCITLPDGRPIFGGTYFTKEQWQKILIDISKLYQETPEKALEYADRLTKGLKETNLINLNKERPVFTKEDLQSLIVKSRGLLDMEMGGFKGAPKFPMPTTLDYLIRYQYQFSDVATKDYLNTTLTKMAYGGIYDQVVGGFSRYSVDDKWHVPHFEKMLYDNAQLVSIYSKAYMSSQNDLYKNIIEHSLEFIENELTSKNGAFYSSLDADSKNSLGESEEGAFYVWTKSEIENLIKEDFKLLEEYYNINEYGYWEKSNYVLIRNNSNSDFAQKYNLSKEELDSKIKGWRLTLNAARSKREKPNLDDKILTSWNALMIQGYVDAFRALGNQQYLQKAMSNAEFLLKNQLRKDGGLNRNYKNGKSTINAYAEDYATFIQALISLYEVTFEEKYLAQSKELMQYTIEHFLEPTNGMFYYTSNLDKDLITRKTEVIDGVIPSSNSILANNLYKLGHFYYDSKMIKMAEQMLNNMRPEIDRNPLAYANWLQVMTNITNPFYEVAVVGYKSENIAKQIRETYIPNIILGGSNKESDQPLLVNKYNEDETFIYVCVNGTCKLPQTNIENALKSIKK